METETGFPRRILVLVMLILSWTMLLNSASAFSTGDTVEGLIEAVLVLVLVGILVDGRLARALEGRPVARTVIPILILIVFVILYGELPQLLQSEVSVRGEAYLPGILSLVQSVGSVVLGILLLMETIRLAIRKPA